VQNIAIILALLLVPYLALIPVQVKEPIRARIGILCVFVFTSVGHFVKTQEMSRVLPPSIPKRIPSHALSVSCCAYFWPPFFPRTFMQPFSGLILAVTE